MSALPVRLLPVLLRGRMDYRSKVLGYSPSIYHPLDDESGAAALDLGEVQNGVYVNSPSLAQDADPFTAPHFLASSSQFVNLTTPATFRTWCQNNFNKFSLAFWVCLDDWSDATAVQGLIYAEGAGPSFLRINHPNTSRRFTAILYTAATGYTFVKNDVTDGWHHFAMTSDYATTDQQFYWDGDPAANTALVGDYTAAPSFVVYAAATTTPHSPLTGYLAHVAWWNKILTPTDIKALATV